jgi:DNA uptake protein ComE-like DNA-binding protein
VLDSTHRVSATFKFDTSDIFTRPEKKYHSEPIDVNKLELDADKIVKEDKISVNEADSEMLMKVPGITKSIANNIVLYRHIHGKYRTLRDLLNVPNFDTKVYDLTKNLLTL